MTGQLITLPARLWLRGAKMLLHTAEDVTGRALLASLRVVGTLNDLRSGGGDEASHAAPAPAARLREDPGERAQAPGAAEPDPRIARRAASDPAPVAPPHNGASEPLASERLAEEGVSTEVDLEAARTEPTHVSEQATIVRESAEPGAQDGAGATIRIDEPWQGYEQMTARDIAARLTGASPAELAAIQLYESANRNRQTVLQAVERELRTANRGR
jgi:hypothetical protein